MGRSQQTKLTRESQAIPIADNLKARTWHTLHPEAAPVLLADPCSSIARRAGFATDMGFVSPRNSRRSSAVKLGEATRGRLPRLGQRPVARAR
jgi:hypothetical protein